MAIVVGNEVALACSGSQTLGRRGGVMFGIVNAVASATDMDVLWEDGTLSQHINGNLALDLVVPGSTDEAVVRFTDSGERNANYQCVVARAYSRQPGGSGATTNYLLLRSTSSGQLYEAPVTAVAPIPGQ